MTDDEPEQTSVLWRIILVFIGGGMAVTGVRLIMSVFLIYIGLPLFVFRVALVEVALRAPLSARSHRGR